MRINYRPGHYKCLATLYFHMLAVSLWCTWRMKFSLQLILANIVQYSTLWEKWINTVDGRHAVIVNVYFIRIRFLTDTCKDIVVFYTAYLY